MVLADTSLWVDYFRRGNTGFAEMLEDTQIATHSFVIGELACGNLQSRATILRLLNNLPRVPQASHENVLAFIEDKHLYSKGIGYTDAHLLVSALLFETPLWTLDKRLHLLALDLGGAFKS